VKGEWRYPYCAVDKYGETVDFLLTENRDQEAALRFLKKALRNAVMRPITPEWGLVEEVLSDALQEVLRQGRAKGGRATRADGDIEALLRPYADRLKKIPREYIRCEEGCPVAVQDQDKETNSFEALAHDFKTTPAILTKVNGRGD
jgi:DDE domain